ncbi:MAG: hypothetical protein ACM3US_08115 [Sphingomonadaceae bacterium]
MVLPQCLSQWHISFGDGFLGILADSLLFYLVAVVLLTYLGLGLTALTLPKDVRPFGWLVAPYLGFSLLVTLTGLLVALGATVRTTLTLALIIATAINLWIVFCGRLRFRIGSPRWWLFLLALALPSYAITALTMAHNGTLAYVGGQGDLYLLVPLAEWLREHSAPLFSFSTDSLLSHSWNASVPPIGDWYDREAHLSFAGHRADDANFLFQRGPRYLESALGLVLGWDSALVFRPAQAFVLSLSLPAVFLFCQILIRASCKASLVVAVLTGLNGTLFFWVLFGHPGQAVSLFLTPMAIVATLRALEGQESPPLLAAALIVSALLISYYQGAPLLLFLMVPGVIYLGIRSNDRPQMVARVALIGLGTLLLTLPEQLKLSLLVLTTGLPQTSGWSNSDFSPISDMLGTTLISQAFGIVAGQGQLGPLGTELLECLSAAVTWAAIIVAGVGLVFTKGLGLYRSLLLGSFALLAYLRVSGYPYGYSKAQAGITFLLAPAVVIGLAALWNWADHWTSRFGQLRTYNRVLAMLSTGILGLLLITMLSANLTLGAYVFWKPVGNIWNPKTWEATKLTKMLPAGVLTKVSPSILADPEAIWMLLYALRNQRLQGAFPIERMIAELSVAPETIRQRSDEPSEVEIVGANEIAAARGLLPSDQIWAGSLMKAYRTPQRDAVDVYRHPNTSSDQLPARLPITVEIPTNDTPHPRSSPSAYLIATFAAEATSTIQTETSQGVYSFQIAKGVTVHSLPVQLGDQITLSSKDPSQPWILAAHVRNGGQDLSIHEEYPKTLVAVGNSRMEGNTISTHLTYLDVQVPVSHSLDIYDTHGYSHPGWFELPTNPDERIKEIRFDLNPATLEHHATVNGKPEERQSSTRPPVDGEYTAYFTLWAGDVIAKRIPLYRYRLAGEQVVEFEPFSLEGIWDGLSSMR